MNRLRRSDRFRRWPAILGTVLLAAGMTVASVSRAAPLSVRLPDGHAVEYRVTRDGAPIGSYTVTVRTEGDRVTVSTAVRIEVAFGFITLYRYALDAREVWRAGRLVSFDSTTDDDGERHAVRAFAEAGVIEVTADGGRWTAPPAVDRALEPVASRSRRQRHVARCRGRRPPRGRGPLGRPGDRVCRRTSGARDPLHRFGRCRARAVVRRRRHAGAPAADRA